MRALLGYVNRIVALIQRPEVVRASRPRAAEVKQTRACWNAGVEDAEIRAERSPLSRHDECVRNWIDRMAQGVVGT